MFNRNILKDSAVGCQDYLHSAEPCQQSQKNGSHAVSKQSEL